MNTTSKNDSRLKRKRRVRARVFGTAQRPRLTVFKSLKGLYCQVINDDKGMTLAAADIKEIKKAKNTIEGAKALGELIAKKCKDAKIETVVFDRSGYQYHGKVKALADGAREGGLTF
jgi:large subunit ribosomal protein L18